MIELAGVRVEHPRGGAPLLDGADLVLGRGQVALLGAAAGAGSSRLCGVLTGEQVATTGRVELFGRDLRRLRRASLLRLRRRIGIVPQDLRLLGEATALANVVLPLDIDHVPRREASIRALESLGRVGLAAEAEVRIDELSYAERQRVAIARALVREPAIVIADQPTAHQDAGHAVAIARVLAEVAAAGTTVLVASRDEALWGLAGELGWRTLILRDGKIAPVADEVDEIIVEHVIEDDVLDSAPIEIAAEATPPPIEAIPNVVPFPITARTGGAAR